MRGRRTNKKMIRVMTSMGSFDCALTVNEPGKGYTVTVPRLRGVVTFGDTLSEAKKMAKEAIELHCSCLLKKGLAEVRPIARSRSTGRTLARA